VTRRIIVAILMLVLAALFGLTAGCGGELADDIAAKVGETMITQEQLDTRTAEFAAQYGGAVPSEETNPEGYLEFKRNVLEYMITYEMAQQKAAAMQLSVTDEDVQAEIDTILQDNFGGDQTQFDAALESQNMTMDQLKSSYKESMLMQKVYEEVTKDAATVSDDEIAAYYEKNKDSYFVDESRMARHILIAPGADEADDATSTTEASSTTTTKAITEADWAAALAEAKKVREDLAGGADWTEVAAKHSDDAGTKDSGGDLGIVSKGQMVPEFEESVFSLAKNEISQPVKTTYGYHVIQVTEITEAKQYTLDETKEDISSTLVNKKKMEAWEKWIETTRTELGVVYQKGLEQATTTTAVQGTDTSTDTSTSETTATTQAGSTITTAAP
jgi:foldase protein PrsA